MEKEHFNIVVCGYPKSGNTWLTRLTAELLNCPVKGFWSSPNQAEIAVEGKERISLHRVYKSHHQYLSLANDQNIHKIIYIVRDPRDVVLSGLHYFDLSEFRWIDWLEKKILSRKDFIADLADKVFYISKRRAEKMVEILLKGSENLSFREERTWLKPSWRKHVTPFLASKDILKIRYEDLIDDAKLNCKKILEYIGHADVEEERIKSAIEKQSFEFKKKEYMSKSDKVNLKFLRQGKYGEWINKLDDFLVNEINDSLQDLLLRLEY